MSYDAMAGYIYELNDDLVATHAPSELQHLLDLLEASELSTDDVAEFCDCGEWLGVDVDTIYLDRIEQALKKVKAKMLSSTGLEVTLTYIDESNASRYNDVTGTMWCVLNATQPTPAAEEHADHITQQFFCHFG